MMSAKRKLVTVGAALLICVAAVLVYFFSGSSAIESWVGTQLLEMAGGYLGPELHFDRLRYVRPRTILLDNLTLESPDPEHPGKMVAILAVKRARLELTDIPRRGQPVRFSEVVLEKPEFRAIAAKPGDGKLLGFSEFLRHSGKASATPAPATAPAATAPAKPLALSDWLMIRHLEISHGLIVFDPRVEGEPAITLDDINAKLDLTPDASAPGVYAIATTISRQPEMDMQLRGKFNIDTFAVELEQLSVALDLRQENAHYLPPELQKLMKAHEVTGQLQASLTGTLPVMDWRQSALQARLDLTEGQVAFGNTRVRVNSWNCAATAAGGTVTLQKADAKLLGGEVKVHGTLPLDGKRPTDVTAAVSGVKIQQLLRDVKPGQPPLYAGLVAADVTYKAPLDAWNKQAAGGGKFSIQQGRIDHLPGVGEIVTDLSKAAKIALGTGGSSTDSAEGTFTFAGDGVRIDQFGGTASSMAMRGSGTIGFDGKLDLRLNGGPLESLQNSLGPLGKAWASLSDAAAGYHVGGTLAKPEVSLELGAGH